MSQLAKGLPPQTASRDILQGPMQESSCAEGNFNFFNQVVEPLPTAEQPDF